MLTTFIISGFCFSWFKKANGMHGGMDIIGLCSFPEFFRCDPQEMTAEEDTAKTCEKQMK